MVDTRDQDIAIDGFPHGAGGDRRVFIHFVAIEQAPEMQEGFDGPGHRARVQSFSRKYVMTQPNRPARAGKFADLRGRAGTGHDRTDRVRSRVERSNHQRRGG